MAGNAPASSGRNTSALRRAPSRIGTSTSFSTTMPWAGARGAGSLGKLFMSVCASARQPLVGQIDLDLGHRLSPRGKFARKPGLRLLQRGIRLDADELLLERLLQRRSMRGLDNRVEDGRENLFRRLRRRQHALPMQR